jgi:hypothetical protein
VESLRLNHLRSTKLLHSKEANSEIAAAAATTHDTKQGEAAAARVVIGQEQRRNKNAALGFSAFAARWVPNGVGRGKGGGG